MQLSDSLFRQIMQPRAPGGDILDDLLSHPEFPEFLQVIRYAGDRLFFRITGEKQGDLICQVNHFFQVHDYLAVFVSFMICVVARLVSR
jgi:hypothetical protein